MRTLERPPALSPLSKLATRENGGDRNGQPGPSHYSILNATYRPPELLSPDVPDKSINVLGSGNVEVFRYVLNCDNVSIDWRWILISHSLYGHYPIILSPLVCVSLSGSLGRDKIRSLLTFRCFVSSVERLLADSGLDAGSSRLNWFWLNLIRFHGVIRWTVRISVYYRISSADSSVPIREFIRNSSIPLKDQPLA